MLYEVITKTQVVGDAAGAQVGAGEAQIESALSRDIRDVLGTVNEDAVVFDHPQTRNNFV